MIAARTSCTSFENLTRFAAFAACLGLAAGCSIAPFGSDSKSGSGGSTTSSGGTGGAATGASSSGGSAGPSQAFPAAGQNWGQSIATELFQTPDTNYDRSSILGLYQLDTTGDSISPVRVRIAADHIAVAYKSASGDLVGVSASVQVKGDGTIVLLEGAEAVNGSPCTGMRVQIALTAGTAYLARDSGEAVSGHLPLTIASGSCSVTSPDLLRPAGIFEQSIGLVQIGK